VQRTIDFANAQRLPTMLVQRRHVERGALISYYPERYEPCRRLAIYVGKILKGARLGDLPVEQPKNSGW
jgi:putative ABC transport system substrate-binding protein